MTTTKTALTTYTVSTKSEHAKFTVRARDYNHASQIAARKLNSRRGIVANRTTGDHGKSGWFQGYYHDAKIGCLNSTGPAFHVM